MQAGDTIMALSSGSLPAGVAVVRLSGSLVRRTLEALVGTVPPPRKMTLRVIGSAAKLDQGLVVFFPSPNSFTGEDCAELHLHGSRASVKAILNYLTTMGLRLAEAGEFTRRAFENGKLDLLAVEGLGDLINADTEKQRSQALARYSGELSTQVASWRNTMLDLRAEIEARLDFADEGDVADDLPVHWHQSLSALKQSIATALTSVESGRIVREGIRVALAGAPNAGKSSLINALSKSDVAIVSDEAGTTRDVREVPLDIGGQLYILLDLAGLRSTESTAEAEGVRRAYRAIGDADIVLWLQAPDVSNIDRPLTSGALISVATKADLAPHVDVDVSLSIKDGAGLDILLSAIQSIGEGFSGREPSLISHERDRLCLADTFDALEEAQNYIQNWELAAECLRRATASLGRLIGTMDNEAILDRLFSSFCIGK